MPENIKDARPQRRKRAIRGAIGSAMMLLAFGGIFLWLSKTMQMEEGGWAIFWSGFFLACALINALLLVPLGISLKERLNEIKGGEEDAASQY